VIGSAQVGSGVALLDGRALPEFPRDEVSRTLAAE
jgi:hypothetical protein